MIWDDITQAWVRLTGRRVSLDSEPWLNGPSAPPEGVGEAFFSKYAALKGLSVETGVGLLPSIEPLDPGSELHPLVRSFYEQTSAFEIDAWSEWSAILRPFGSLLARIFTRRLGQLNLPLSALDVSRGMHSEILCIALGGTTLYAAWVRSLNATGRVIYCGAYSLVEVPGFEATCVRVVFPLPNGSATVILYPVVHPDGSLSLMSRGSRFGDPGFYFVVERNGRRWARYVRAMQEHIHVYADGVDVRTDHTLRIFGTAFLKIHYRLREKVVA